MNPRVFAVIVCYHPEKQLLDRCLEALRLQVEKIICIDNTENNRGIAAALNEGFSAAASEGADWILSMDQDSILPPDAVQVMLQCADGDSRIVQIGPQWDDNLARGGCLDVPFVITSGSLLKTSAWQDAGPFRKDYFIDFVDVEYSRRLRDRGFRVVCCPQVRMEHHLGEGLLGWNILGKKRLAYIGHHPQRIYYMLRNALLFHQEYPSPESRKLLSRLERSIARMLLQDSRRREILRQVCRAYKDFRMAKNNV